LARLLIYASTVLLLLNVGRTAECGILLDRVVAVVNNEAITWSELYMAMEFELTKNMRSIPDEEKGEIFRENEDSFLESMIDVKVQLQKAEKLGIKVRNQEIESAIQSIKDKYSLEEEEFLEAIRQEGFTPQKYMKMLREQITIRKLIEREIRDKINVTDEEVNKYIEEKNLEDGVQYRLRQIFFRLPEPDNEEQEDALRDKIEMVKKKLDEGADFALLAAQYSDDPSARTTGGDLGLIEKNILSKEFVSALKGLEPGQASSPFRTPQGVHILKLEAKKDARQVIFEKRFNEEYKSWLKGLRAKSFIDIRLQQP
jgi:peptidyl-prolyl cis-trans isomerase SurA